MKRLYKGPISYHPKPSYPYRRRAVLALAIIKNTCPFADFDLTFNSAPVISAAPIEERESGP